MMGKTLVSYSNFSPNKQLSPEYLIKFSGTGTSSLSLEEYIIYLFYTMFLHL